MLHTIKGKRVSSIPQDKTALPMLNVREGLDWLADSQNLVEISQRLIFTPQAPLLLKAADMLSTFSLLMSFNKAQSCPLCNCTFISNSSTEMLLTFTVCI